MTNRIILFDGLCNLCSWSVQFIIARDPDAQFRFASIQSPIGEEILANLHIAPDALDSFVLIDGAECLSKSDAALRVARHLSGWWPMLAVFSVLPRRVRDWAYGVVARHRFRWFGVRSSCMIPTADIRSRFLEEV